jgi:hypothetical protein
MRDVFHSNNWGGSRPGGGRPKGSIDSRPREIREAMIQGAINSDLGKNLKHPDEPPDLINFFTNIANKNYELFCTMLIRLIPRQINTQTDVTADIDVVYRSTEEVRRAMSDAGFGSKQIAAIEAMLPATEEEGNPIDEEVRDDEEISS